MIADTHATDPAVKTETASPKSKESFTISYQIKLSRRTKTLFKFVGRIGHLANHLYNQMLYIAKEYYGYFDIFPTPIGIIPLLRGAVSPYDEEPKYPNPYRHIQALTNTYCVNYTVQSFYGVIQGYKEAKTDFYLHPEKYTGEPKFPKFSRDNIRAFSTGYCILKQDIGTGEYYIQLFKEKETASDMTNIVPIPSGVVNYAKLNNVKHLQQVRFIPITKTRIRIEIVYTPEPIIQMQLNSDRIMAIDLGDKNFATCIANDPLLHPFILDGKMLISWNNYVTHIRGKRYQVMQEIHDQPIVSHSLKELNEWRNRRVDDLFHKYTSYLLKYCFEHDIGTIVLGYNQFWKQNMKQAKGKDGNRKIGRNATRQHSQIPHYKFIAKLQYKCKRYGINVVVQEEDYTSVTDHFGYESMEFHPSNKVKGIKRNLPHPVNPEYTVRGLFYSPALQQAINSDVNGAIGHMRKYNGDQVMPIFFAAVKQRTIFTPHRVKYTEL